MNAVGLHFLKYVAMSAMLSTDIAIDAQTQITTNHLLNKAMVRSLINK